jgi:hypothetical protein
LAVGTNRVHQVAKDLEEWMTESRLGLRLHNSSDREPFSRNKTHDHRFSEARRDPKRDLRRVIIDLNPLGMSADENTFALRVEGKPIGAKTLGVADSDTLIVQRRRPGVGEIVVSQAKKELKLTRYTKEHLKAAAILSSDYEASIRIGGVVIGLIRRI